MTLYFNFCFKTPELRSKKTKRIHPCLIHPKAITYLITILKNQLHIISISPIISRDEIPRYPAGLNRVLQDPLDEGRDAKSCGALFLVIPDGPCHVYVHPLDFLINKLHNQGRRTINVLLNGYRDNF